MDYDLIVVKTLERVYKNYYYIIRGEMHMYNNQAPRINNQYPQSNQFSNTNQNNQTSSAVPFSSQSYPNNPETPGYPQKNP